MRLVRTSALREWALTRALPVGDRVACYPVPASPRPECYHSAGVLSQLANQDKG